MTEDTDWFTDKAEWAGLRSFIMVEDEREVPGERRRSSADISSVAYPPVLSKRCPPADASKTR